ncbi:MAG: phosphatase PAP2 family protein [Micrococcaceae bacterium]
MTAIDNLWLTTMISDRNSFRTVIAEIFNLFSPITWSLIFAIMIAYFIYQRSFRVATFIAGSAGLWLIITTVIKHIVQRPRPPQNDWLVQAQGYSFPSGHSGGIACFVTVCILIFRKVWVQLSGALLVLIMMWSRTYLGVHYLTDVIAGAIIGVASAYLAWYLVSKFYESVYTKLLGLITNKSSKTTVKN